MKHRRVLFLAAIATTSWCLENSCLDTEIDSKCCNCKPQKPSSADETSKVVIANFLAMFANFLTMVTNQDDKQALVNGALGIAQSLGNIATEACKCVELGEISPQELLAYVEQECAKVAAEPLITERLTRAIKAEFYKSLILPDDIRARYAVLI